MGAVSTVLLCGAYCLGLFIASVGVHQLGWDPIIGSLLAGGLVFGTGAIAAILIPRWWRLGPRSPIWLLAGVIGLIATLNYAWRLPQPGSDDVSQILSRGSLAGVEQSVWGTVPDMPHLTRSGKGQFWLNTRQVQPLDQAGQPLGATQPVTGKLYVTVPKSAIAELVPGQQVEVRGRLYQPDLPKNPHGFNFRQYLADHGSFAGFSGKWVNLDQQPPASGLALWRLRQRIADSHAASLGDQAGPLVTAMALGRKAVNLPYPIQDAFIQAGLAHTLAASGFHVSLVLGLVLGVLNRASLVQRLPHPNWSKVGIGATVLLIYALVTGGQPSVWRATVMGFGVLLGIALERRVKPLGCLLMAVTILLVVNPTWIDSIGFRLSVMATLGLMVSVQPVMSRLEWLPPALATLVAVPVAAYLWTIPLQLHYFNTLTTYSILLNIVVTPLVMVISLGGMLSGLVALVAPELGSLLAWVLWLPAHLLIGLVNWEIRQPGSSVATGHISLLQMLALYGLLVFGWVLPWCRKRRWLIGVVALLVAMGPLWYAAVTSSQITVLATGREPVMVIRDHRQALLVNGGSAQTATYTVVPYLRQAGINRLQGAVGLADSSPTAWTTLAETTPIQVLYSEEVGLADLPAIRQILPLPVEPQLLTGNSTVQSLLGAQVLQFSLAGHHTWLRLTELSPKQQRTLTGGDLPLQSEVLWWDGAPLEAELLATINPQVAIASSTNLDQNTEELLQQQGIQVFITDRDGAVTWSQRRGYQAYLAHPNATLVSFE